MSNLKMKLEEQFLEMAPEVCEELVKEMDGRNGSFVLRKMVMDWITDGGRGVQIQLVVTDADDEMLAPFDLESTRVMTVEEFKAEKANL